jgi:membrane associated rhomboid family serine protease
MDFRNFTDPQLGPVLSGLIWFLVAMAMFLVVGLLFSPNPTVVGGAFTAIMGLIGLVVQQRGRIEDRRNGK